MDPGDPLVLFVEAYWQSPWDFACYVALREKGLPFGTATGFLSEGVGVTEALRAQTFAPRIPALQHGDFWLTESAAIVEYLEQAYTPPRHPRLFPADPQRGARARQLSILTRMEWDALRQERPSRTIFYPALAGQVAPFTERGARHAGELVAAATSLLQAGRPFLFDEFSIADADLAFALMRLIRGGDPVPDDVRAYAERIWMRPSIHGFASHPRPPNPPRW
jgi:glutathione S-transferase